MNAIQSTPKLRMSCLGIIGILLTLASASQVGAEVKARQDSSDTAALTQANPETAAAKSTSSKVQSFSNLRCWQDGTLLFEETNLNDQALAKAKQVLVFDQKDVQGEGEVFLIETGSTTCLYKKA